MCALPSSRPLCLMTRTQGTRVFARFVRSHTFLAFVSARTSPGHVSISTRYTFVRPCRTLACDVHRVRLHHMYTCAYSSGRSLPQRLSQRLSHATRTPPSSVESAERRQGSASGRERAGESPCSGWAEGEGGGSTRRGPTLPFRRNTPRRMCPPQREQRTYSSSTQPARRATRQC